MNVVLAAFVTGGNIKIAILAEMEIAAIMVELAIDHAVKHLLPVGVNGEADWIGGEPGNAIEIGRTSRSNVRREKNAVRGESRMKFQAQQPQLAVGRAAVEGNLTRNV